MEYKSNNKTPKPTEKNEENKFGKLSPELEKLEKEWTVEDTDGSMSVFDKRRGGNSSQNGLVNLI